jgi:hypothetical protein
MNKPVYTFDTDGHTVVAGDSAKRDITENKILGIPFTWWIYLMIVLTVLVPSVIVFYRVGIRFWWGLP